MCADSYDMNGQKWSDMTSSCTDTHGQQYIKLTVTDKYAYGDDMNGQKCWSKI